MFQRAAQQYNDPRLSALAFKVRMDAFGKVKDTIQAMVERLLKEKEDEIKKKDWCVDELNTNTRSTMDGEREKSALLQTGDSQIPSFKKYEKNKSAGGVMGMM